MKLKPFNTLTIDEIAKVLKAIPELKSWISNIEEYALERAEAGVAIPGFELGRARSSRVWLDYVEVAAILKEQKYALDDVYPRELLSVAQMEKYLGKEKFNSLVSVQVGEKIGLPKLVITK
jgi:hypothetical protein